MVNSCDNNVSAEAKRPDNKATAGEQEYIRSLESRVNTLTTFIKNSEAGMYVTDFYTGEILFANRKTIAMFGYTIKSEEEMIGKVCWELINPNGGGRCSFCRNSILLGDDGELLEPHSWEHLFGEFGVWLRIISQAIIWSDGRLAQMNTFYDITEVKRMQEELASHAREKEHRRMLQNLQMILDLLPLPVGITEKKTARLVYANDALAKMFGFESPGGMIGLTFNEFIAPIQSDGMTPNEKLGKLLLCDDPFSLELECLTTKGALVDGRINVRTIEYLGKRCSLGIITDLEAEREQLRLLKAAAEKEREANKLKSNFLSNMSHEIRTPMNAIIGLTEIELCKAHSRDSLETYRKINISAKNLLQIVNDILDLSKIEADKLELIEEEFNLEDVLNNVLLVVSPRLEGKHVELLLDIAGCLPCHMVGDKTRLWQVLKNYLDNAAKFTQRGSIMLSVDEDKLQSTDDTLFVKFVVTDTGIGMSEKHLEKAMLPFEQIYSGFQKQYMGTGLGLPLSKRICELMGGTLKIESRLGHGTTIRFTLPFARCAKSNASSPQSLSELNVLIVDDSDVSLMVMGSALKKVGFSYATAHSGREALTLIRNRSDFDVILMDYIIGGENCMDTVAKIKKIVPDSTKILLVTAYGSRLKTDELKEHGISDIIEKPFVPSLFYSKILAAVDQTHDRNELEASKYIKFSDVRVLVCEDNEINQIVALGMLEQFGITAVTANNGKAGIEALLQNLNDPFDLILMDVHMPVMDGYEATCVIRSDRRFDNIPIICLTADAMKEVIDQCLSCGMNAYLSKPFVLSDFHAMLLKWLPRHKREQA